MKVVIVGDTHFGIRAGSNHFAQYQIRFFNDLLFPYMEANGIDTIIQTGDLFDNRTVLNLKSFHKIKKYIFDKMLEHNYTMHTLVGNHDMQLRESVKMNTSELLLRDYPNITIHSNPSTLQFGSSTIDIIPWICIENKTEIEEFIKRPNISDILIGHLEIAGAMMQRGIPGHGGFDCSIFGRYTSVLSGHYHTRSFLDNKRINYVGTPYEMNWGDSGDTRGFTVLDTETFQYTYVPNPECMFIKIRYKDGCFINPKTLTGKYVKLIVESKKNLVDFDNFINTLKIADPYDLTIIETVEDLSGGEIDELIEIHDTNEIISQYIDGLDVSIDKNSIKQYIHSLYVEAVNNQ